MAVVCVQASVKRDVDHVGPISPRLPSKYHGAGRSQGP